MVSSEESHPDDTLIHFKGGISTVD